MNQLQSLIQERIDLYNLELTQVNEEAIHFESHYKFKAKHLLSRIEVLKKYIVISTENIKLYDHEPI